MPAGEGEEALLARGAMCQIGLQDAFDRARRLLFRHVAIEFAAERRVRSETAADIDVIALDRIGILACLDLAG